MSTILQRTPCSSAIESTVLSRFTYRGDSRFLISPSHAASIKCCVDRVNPKTNTARQQTVVEQAAGIESLSGGDPATSSSCVLHSCSSAPSDGMNAVYCALASF